MKNLILSFLLLLVSACSEFVNVNQQQEEELNTKSISSGESTFPITGIPDYIVRADDLVKIYGEDKHLKLELQLNNDEVGIDIDPDILGFYSSSYGVKYERNSGCYYDLGYPLCFDVTFGFAHLNILSLKINYIPPFIESGELIIHTIVRSNGAIFDRYISVQGIAHTMINF